MVSFLAYNDTLVVGWVLDHHLQHSNSSRGYEMNDPVLGKWVLVQLQVQQPY